VPLDQVQVLPCRPHTCAHCGADLPTEGGTVVARRQVTDLPSVQPVVVEAQRRRVRGRRCGHGTVGAYPDGFGATGAFGPRLVATAALLHEEHHVAYARLVELFGGLCGLTVSEGRWWKRWSAGRALGLAAAAIATRCAAPRVGQMRPARGSMGELVEWIFQTRRRRTTIPPPQREVVLSFLDGGSRRVVSDLEPQLAPCRQYRFVWRTSC
jgi:hypothetical protein